MYGISLFDMDRGSDPFSLSNDPFERANVPNRRANDPIPSPNAPFRWSNVRFHTIVDNSSPFLLLKSLEESTEREKLRLFVRVPHFRPRMSRLNERMSRIEGRVPHFRFRMSRLNERMSRIALECPKMPVECPSTPLYPQIKKIGYYSNLLN